MSDQNRSQENAEAARKGAPIDITRLKGMRVLLAEDNVTNQLVASQMLENLGARVDVASDGAIALERLTQNTYDILLVDIEMPRVSGMDVIRSIRASDGPLAEAPVIALTAYAMQEHRDKIHEAGADGLIPKPIISIEQFGIDVLTFFDANRQRFAAMRVAAANAAAPSAQTAAAPEAPIDEDIFNSLARSIGDEAMVELLAKIEVDLENVRTQIAEAERRDNPGAMRAATHVLTSVAGAVGGVRLQGRAERLNTLAHAGDAAAISEFTGETLDDLDQVLAFVRVKIGDDPC